jgi:hypothetical protein
MLDLSFHSCEYEECGLHGDSTQKTVLLNVMFALWYTNARLRARSRTLPTQTNTQYLQPVCVGTASYLRFF